MTTAMIFVATAMTDMHQTRTFHNLFEERTPFAPPLLRNMAAHNGLVAGSSPAGPTNDFNGLQKISLPQRFFGNDNGNETAGAWRPRQGANKQAISSAYLFQTGSDRPLNLNGNFGKFQTGFWPEA